VDIVKITKTEYTLRDGSILPIDPPLLEVMTVEEFKKHYDFAAEVIRSCRDAGCNNTDSPGVE